MTLCGTNPAHYKGSIAWEPLVSEDYWRIKLEPSQSTGPHTPTDQLTPSLTLVHRFSTGPQTAIKKCSQTCPTCRASSSSGEIVKHLYFDDPDEHNGSSLLTSPNSQRLRLAEEAVRGLKNSLHRKEEELEDLKNAYAHAVMREYLKNAELSRENASLSAKNKEMEKILETSRRRLQACELYKTITAGDDETVLGRLVTDDGSIRMQSVLNIQKRQLLVAKSLQSRLREDLRQEREQLRASKRKESELENYVKGLERELRELRAVREKPLKERLRPRNIATTSRVVEKSRENTDSRDVVPKRKTRRPLVDRNGSQEDANSADSKEEEQ
ncbi:unnamed protein product [Cylicocyclus nassatus]|uniref:Uncharacterized protein n=1 Tax=Cylicocyclus nassatus TaxID=53992 RepID=A0AA36HE85_CYLNA|nr:unnamed protein product [Cylicocyclus nassatus]